VFGCYERFETAFSWDFSELLGCDCYAVHVLSLFTYNCFTKKNAYFGAYCIIFACVVLLFVNGRYWAVLRMLKYMNIS